MTAYYDNYYKMFILDNDAVKALRFVFGLNTDLRVKLHLRSERYDALVSRMTDFLEKNGYNIFGISFHDFILEYPDPCCPDHRRIIGNAIDRISGY